MPGFRPIPAKIKQAAKPKKTTAIKGTGTANVPPRPAVTTGPAPVGAIPSVPGGGGLPASTPIWHLTPEQQQQLALEGNGNPLIYHPPDATHPSGWTEPNPSWDATPGSTKNLGINPAAAIGGLQASDAAAEADAIVQGAQIEMDRANQADSTTNVEIARGLLNSSITTKDLQDVQAAAERRKTALTTSLTLLHAANKREMDRVMGAANLVSQTAGGQGIANAHDDTVDPGTPAAPVSGTSGTVIPGYQTAAGPTTPANAGRPVSGTGRTATAPVQQAAATSVANKKKNGKPKPKVTTSTNAWHPGIQVSGY